MHEGSQHDVTITSRGQLTLPLGIRQTLKLGSRRKVRIAVNDEGVITVRPLPDVMSFRGALKNNVPYDPREKQKARHAMGRRAAK
jgi:bifunctional DNA-binding transcriptional regulator/antitoxin component of YhaV-PrlF toxin-antitoxin module